jgi:hypothetical protein
MSERQSPSAGPSSNDQPFVPSGMPNKLPAGAVFKPAANTWYNLRVTYTDTSRNTVNGYLYPLGANPSTMFWDYMAFISLDGLPPAKFMLHELEDGWAEWELDNGDYLSVKATGYVYRASAYRIGWQVIDSKLYNNYWPGPAGYKWDSSTFVPGDYYVGMELPVFTCELVPA